MKVAPWTSMAGSETISITHFTLAIIFAFAPLAFYGDSLKILCNRCLPVTDAIAYSIYAGSSAFFCAIHLLCFHQKGLKR